jgi:hypothetical protein
MLASVPERHEVSTFLEFRSQLPPAQFATESKLSDLMKQAEYPLASRPGIESSDRVAVPFYLNLESAAASNAGRILVDFDMEVRRTTSYQLRTSMAPPRNSRYVEVVGAEQDEAFRIVLALSNELRLALTTQPIEFLLTLDWFWDFRYSKSRVRNPVGQRNPHERWQNIFSSASECAASSQPVSAEMVIGRHGNTTFKFRTDR